VTPPFQTESASLPLLRRLLRRLLLRGLLGHSHPPLHQGFSSIGSSHRACRAPLPPGTIGPGAGAPDLAGALPRERESHRQERGGGTLGSRPRHRHRLALLRRLLGGLLLRAGLRSLLRHSSSWESWLPSCHRLPRGHNRWAERSTCIRDVDYGRENHPVKHNLPQKSKKLMPRARVMRQAVSTIGSRLSTARARIALTIAFRSNARRSAGGPRTACARTAARTAHR